jgi:ankyrin repeat protein
LQNEEDLGEIAAARLCAAVAAKDLGKIEEMIENGIDINSTTPGDMRSALHVACAEGDAGMARHLLLAGASPDLLDRHGRSPLEDAVVFDHHETISVMRSFGASLQSSQVGHHLCEYEIYLTHI